MRTKWIFAGSHCAQGHAFPPRRRNAATPKRRNAAATDGVITRSCVAQGGSAGFGAAVGFGYVPVPLSATVWVPLLMTTYTVAFFKPTVSGVKMTVTGQLAPAAST